MFLPSAAGIEAVSGIITDIPQMYQRIVTYVGLVHGIGGKICTGDVPAGSAFALQIQEQRRLDLNAAHVAGKPGDWYWDISTFFSNQLADYMQDDHQHLSVKGHKMAARHAALSLQGEYA